MLNLDVDVYTKTQNNRKTIRKMQKKNNLLKTKTILKLKYKLEVGLSAPCQLRLRLWYFVFTYNRINSEPSPENCQVGGFAFVGGSLRSCRGLDIQIW